MGFSLDAKDKRFIGKIIGAAFNVEPEVVDLQSYQYKPGNERILITIGGHRSVPVQTASKCPSTATYLRIPDLDELDPDTGDENIRLEVWNNLLAMRKYLDAPVVSEQTSSLTPDQLPVIEADKVPALEKDYPRGWVGITKDGKSIKLTKSPTTEGSEDIKMTFAELQAIKTAVELLGVREFELVPSNQADPSPSSSNSGE